jgi:putative pyruvate formate lyase activating enzyme
LGYCKSGAGFSIGSICLHKGEEPVIGGRHGICNVFFTRCNLQCMYCQNFQISRNKHPEIEYQLNLEEVLNKIIQILDGGCNTVGFVSASHFIPQINIIIHALSEVGRKPIYVFNTNAYDKPETLRQLEGIIDIYLPDFKYIDNEISVKFSDAPNYPTIALKAIKEMYYQKGSSLIINDNGEAESGLIVRHLVLPGLVDHSIRLFETLANEVSTSIHIALMSQYYPIDEVLGHSLLKRKVTREEYNKVAEAFENLGFYKGWMQFEESPDYYKPDFVLHHPFDR